MTEPFTKIKFPRLVNIQSLRMTRSLGTASDTGLITSVPDHRFRQPPALIGDLEIEHGSDTLTLPDCRLTALKDDGPGESKVWTFQVRDRRWRWKWATVDGEYNIIDGEKNEVRVDSKRSTRELVSDCLEALDEKQFDVKAVPDDEYPLTNWLDVVSAATALEQLLRPIGMRVALSLKTNRVKVVRLGHGKQLRTRHIIRDSDELVVEPSADAVQILCGPTLWQSRLKLEPYCRTSLDAPVPLDKTDFKPTDGWKYQSVEYFGDVKATKHDTAEHNRQRAIEDVFRLYKVTGLASDEDKLPGTELRIKEPWQLFPLETQRLVTTTDEDEVKHRKPAAVLGIYYPERLGTKNTEKWSHYDGSFTISTDDGFVRFSQPVYKFIDDTNPTAGIEAADIYLETAHVLRDPETRAFERHSKDRELPVFQAGTPPQVIKRAELRLQIIQEYVTTIEIFPSLPNTTSLITPPTVNVKQNTGHTDNTEELDEQIKYYLEQHTERFQQSVESRVKTVVGLDKRMDIDGRIRQVSIAFEGGLTMTASENTEHDYEIPSYADRERSQRIARAESHEGVDPT